MKRDGVRKSACPSMGPQQQIRSGSKPAPAGLLLLAWRAGDIDRLLWANAGSATLSAYVDSRTRSRSALRRTVP